MNMTLSETDLARAQGTTLAVALVLQEGCNLLSVAAAADLLQASGVPLTCRMLSDQGHPVQSACGLRIAAQGGLDKVDGADLILVFGEASPALATHLRQAWMQGAIVGGIGAGLAALAEAGLLTGRRFALHRAEAAAFARRWPDLTPDEASYCLDQRVASCPDGMLVVDLVLLIIQQRIGVSAMRRVMVRHAISDRRAAIDPQTTGALARSACDDPRLKAALAYLSRNFRKPDALKRIGAEIGVSRRQIERMFRDKVKVSLAQHMAALKLRHAKDLLAGTYMDMAQIAAASGFQTSAQFSKAYRRHFGQSPHSFLTYADGTEP